MNIWNNQNGAASGREPRRFLLKNLMKKARSTSFKCVERAFVLLETEPVCLQ